MSDLLCRRGRYYSAHSRLQRAEQRCQTMATRMREKQDSQHLPCQCRPRLAKFPRVLPKHPSRLPSFVQLGYSLGLRLALALFTLAGPPIVGSFYLPWKSRIPPGAAPQDPPRPDDLDPPAPDRPPRPSRAAECGVRGEAKFGGQQSDRLRGCDRDFRSCRLRCDAMRCDAGSLLVQPGLLSEQAGRSPLTLSRLLCCVSPFAGIVQADGVIVRMNDFVAAWLSQWSGALVKTRD